MKGKKLYDRDAAQTERLTGQNVRGLTTLKLEKVIQFMKDHRVLVTCLMETWQVTPNGMLEEEIDGFLILHHGETTRSCKRGRNGVAIILSPAARAANFCTAMTAEYSLWFWLSKMQKLSRCVVLTHLTAVQAQRFDNPSTTKWLFKPAVAKVPRTCWQYSSMQTLRQEWAYTRVTSLQVHHAPWGLGANGT